MVKKKPSPSYWRVACALALSAALSIGLYVLRSVEGQSSRHSYLIWNLFLAWLPLLFAWWLGRRLKHTLWSHPANIALTVLWLGFLPNSFYLASDLIHLEVTGEVSILYDVVLFCSFIFNAYTAGMISLYLIHRQLLARGSAWVAHGLIGGAIFLCSFAIYLGRYLRWNTWDVLVNPAGILFDVSDRVISPTTHPQAIVTTLTFFMFIGTMYIVVWQLVQAIRGSRPH